MTLLTAEHLREVTWTYWWFPSMSTCALAQRPTLEQLLDQLPGGEAIPLEINDLEDASIAALCRFPEHPRSGHLRRRDPAHLDSPYSLTQAAER